MTMCGSASEEVGASSLVNGVVNPLTYTPWASLPIEVGCPVPLSVQGQHCRGSPSFIISNSQADFVEVIWWKS